MLIVVFYDFKISLSFFEHSQRKFFDGFLLSFPHTCGECRVIQFHIRVSKIFLAIHIPLVQNGLTGTFDHKKVIFKLKFRIHHNCRIILRVFLVARFKTFKAVLSSR